MRKKIGNIWTLRKGYLTKLERNVTYDVVIIDQKMNKEKVVATNVDIKGNSINCDRNEWIAPLDVKMKSKEFHHFAFDGILTPLNEYLMQKSGRYEQIGVDFKYKGRDKNPYEGDYTARPVGMTKSYRAEPRRLKVRFDCNAEMTAKVLELEFLKYIENVFGLSEIKLHHPELFYLVTGLFIDMEIDFVTKIMNDQNEVKDSLYSYNVPVTIKDKCEDPLLIAHIYHKHNGSNGYYHYEVFDRLSELFDYFNSFTTRFKVEFRVKEIVDVPCFVNDVKENVTLIKKTWDDNTESLDFIGCKITIGLSESEDDYTRVNDSRLLTTDILIDNKGNIRFSTFEGNTYIKGGDDKLGNIMEKLDVKIGNGMKNSILGLSDQVTNKLKIELPKLNNMEAMFISNTMSLLESFYGQHTDTVMLHKRFLHIVTKQTQEAIINALQRLFTKFIYDGTLSRNQGFDLIPNIPESLASVTREFIHNDNTYRINMEMFVVQHSQFLSEPLKV